MARQLAKNLILRLDIEELVEHPESAKSAEIRAKYRREIENRNENEQATKTKKYERSIWQRNYRRCPIEGQVHRTSVFRA
jgi:hypothetical protein